MPFIGQTPVAGAYQILDSITTSATNTFALTLSGSPYYPETAQNLIVSLNGVTQAPISAYTVDSSNIIFASALTVDDVIDYILVLGDVLDIATPSDNTVSTSKLQNYSVTSVKMSNTGVTAASYGSASAIPVITIDAAGRITSASTTAVAGIANTNWYSANNTFAIGTGDGSTFNTTISQFDNLTITGDLIVNGNTTTISATTLNVDDPLIKLAAGNETSDTVDIGFLGHYSPDGGNTALHTGFFRDATDGQYYLFTGLEDAALDANTGPNTIDRTANTFTFANLNVGNFTSTGIDDNATSTALTISSGGNVGIGESTPSGLLHVKKADSGASIVSGSASTLIVEGATNTGITIRAPNTSKGSLFFQDPQSTAAGYLQYDHSDDSMRIGSTGIERMRIDSSGNVGIGETSPDGLLHLKSTAPDIILEDSNTASAIGSSNRVRFRNSSGTYSAQIGNDPSIDSGVNFTLGTLVNYPVGIMTNGSTKMTIAANGNIGIANSDPSELLYVQGDIEVGAKRSLYEAYLSNAVNWVKIYEKHYQSSSAFNYGGQHVLVTQSGATGGQSSYAEIHINNKQQSTGDYNTIVYTEGGGERVMDVAYYYDSAGGDYSGGLLTVWVKAVLAYMTVAVHGLSNSKPDKDNAGQLMAVDTGSSTQPASSTLLSPNITNLETTYIGIGESSPSSKLHVKDGGYGIRIGSDTVHTDTTNIPTTEMIMFNRTTDGADIASIGVMDGAAGRLGLFSREGFKFYVGGGIDWTYTSLGFTIDNVGNIVYPPSGSDTGLYFGGETSGSSYGYIRNPAGTDGQIEIGSDAGVTFTETDNDLVKAMFDLNNGLFNFYGTVQPGTTNTYDLGTSSLRWNNIYTNDLHLSNEGKEGGNDVDGTTGDWTIQEGEEDLYIVNNKSGKKYKFKLEEV